ncbi:hypothetical protein ACWGDS_04775 [Streptomyces sp. NPDC055059]|jgi:hypothetical protein|uniref:hypothetical protein n=1 Tax=Streptomyces sp. NPDC127172 TaxID=3345382 RepID=UPI0036376B57
MRMSLAGPPTRFRSSTGLGRITSLARVADVLASQVIATLLPASGTDAAFCLIAGPEFAFALLAGLCRPGPRCPWRRHSSAALSRRTARRGPDAGP